MSTQVNSWNDSFPICSNRAWRQLQDGHTFQAGVLRSPIGRNSPHARTDDTQLFPQHRHFGFELVDSGVWRITVLDQRFACA